MQNKSNKTMEFKAGKADKNFTEERLTNYTGLAIVSKYIQTQSLGSLLDGLFPTTKQNATKFSTTQIMLAVVLASMSDVHRMNRIENFICDPLVQLLLNLLLTLRYRYKHYESMGALYRSMNAEILNETLDRRLWELFQELVCTVAEIFGMDADELLEKLLTNQKAEAMISIMLETCASDDDWPNG